MDTTIPGHLRRPRGVARPPVGVLVPGLGSVKEELFAMEGDFLRRGMATLTVDGPGQGESAPRFPIRADWSSVVRPIIDVLEVRPDVDAGSVGLMGISMGGIYGPLAAAGEKRIRALVALAGPERADPGRLRLLHEVPGRGGGVREEQDPGVPWRA